MPDDERTIQDRLAWWLFRDDVTRIEYRDDQETSRIETSEERITDAIESLVSLLKAATFSEESCLGALRQVQRILASLKDRNLPLGMAVIRCGTPEAFRFDESRIRFDGECLEQSLNGLARKLGISTIQLEWRKPPQGYSFSTDDPAFKDVRSFMESWRDVLAIEIQRREELPPGWEPQGTTWPAKPIRTTADLCEWLSAWLMGLYDARASVSPWRQTPEGYLEDFRRELRNSVRAGRTWGLKLPEEFNDTPKNIIEAEKEMVRLIDWLKASVEGTPTRSSTATSARDENASQPISGVPRSRKKSSKNGDAKAKLISALTQHHRYADGGCLNYEPIGCNALSRIADVAKSTASSFLKSTFQSRGGYQQACHDSATLIACLKVLNQEFSTRDILRGKDNLSTTEDSEPADE
ncbi:MAG: hypothetical protein U0929_17320 [Planctomycetaceae bacterium]